VRLLLDTNILVPILHEKLSELPSTICAVLESNDVDFFVSAASLWEMAIKSRLGKLILPCREEVLPDSFATTGFLLLPVSPVHATTPVDTWPQTNDPFDRILLSVCKVENLRLVTLDRALVDHPLAWRA
jgi:PIN domain nuclease of toxin-antitoxin system